MMDLVFQSRFPRKQENQKSEKLSIIINVFYKAHSIRKHTLYAHNINITNR